MFGKMKIGIFDWGIGGLGFTRLLMADRPDLEVVYLGDQGATPYGRMSKSELQSRINDVLAWFASREISRVVVACNAASTALPILAPHWESRGLSATGMILPGLRAACRLERSERIGIIGGGRTIRSGSYANPLRQQGFQVVQRVAQPLSRLIEDGLAESPEANSELARILRPMQGVTTLVLACTHYVVMAPSISRMLPGIKLLDPAAQAWQELAANLPGKSLNESSPPSLYTTGDPDAMALQAKRAFGVCAAVSPTIVPVSRVMCER